LNAPRFFWRIIQIGPRIAYALALSPLIGRFVLLLTTVGRSTGRSWVTPLVYDELGDTILVASARGPRSDWLRNIKAHPKVHVQIGRRHIDGLATVVTDPEAIVNYLERQMRRNPRMFKAILRSEGLPSRPSREDLLILAPKRPMVAIRAINDAAKQVAGANAVSTGL